MILLDRALAQRFPAIGPSFTARGWLEIQKLRSLATYGPPNGPRVGAKSTVSPSERITSAVKQLAVSAADVKSAADELCGNIAPFEAILAKFDLGVSARYQIAGHELDNGSYGSRDIGYTKIGKKWGIALRKVEGHHAAEFDDEDIWFFKDAPRWMQIESATKIPDLVSSD